MLVLTLVFLCYNSFSHGQEKRLRVNMRLKKLQEKVKEQQEKVGEKVNFLIRKSRLCSTYIIIICFHFKSSSFRYKLSQKQPACTLMCGLKMLIGGLLGFLRCLRNVAIKW